MILARRLDHPLVGTIVPVARRLVDGDLPEVWEALDAMREVARFPGQYAALAITYFAADDRESILDAEYDAVSRAWKAGDRAP